MSLRVDYEGHDRVKAELSWPAGVTLDLTFNWVGGEGFVERLRAGSVALEVRLPHGFTNLPTAPPVEPSHGSGWISKLLACTLESGGTRAEGHAHVQFHARGLYGKAVDVRLTLRGLATARVAEAAGAKPERRGAFWVRALPAAAGRPRSPARSLASSSRASSGRRVGVNYIRIRSRTEAQAERPPRLQHRDSRLCTALPGLARRLGSARTVRRIAREIGTA